MKKLAILPFFAYIAFVFIFCEFLIYYFVIFKCSWPHVGTEAESEGGVKAILLSDTHLLGPRRGHWFDKLRREWQMHRAFQTAITLFHPNAVFILGDVFDEGEWSDQVQFAEYMARFGNLFRVPPDVKIHVVPGNHDVGFHYVSTPRLVHQFHAAFNLSSSPVQLLTLSNVHFVLINSMAFEGDNCDFCTQATRQLISLSGQLGCNRTGGGCSLGRPIVLQHFPMYRKSDLLCHEPDEAPIYVKNETFREKWDCLSKEASEELYKLLRPRAIFTGHTHHGCHTVHRGDIHEYTIPSFSWRNKDNPTFTMAMINDEEVAVSKCQMPRESTVIGIYTTAGAVLLLWALARLLCWSYIASRFWPFYKWKIS